MRSLADGAGIERWFAGLRSRTVVLSTACSPGECTVRLASVTAQRGLGAWYRDPQNYHRGDPRLLGRVGPCEISVGRYPEATRRNSFAPWIVARPTATSEGGTTLTGSIGLGSGVGALMVATAALWAMMALAVVAEGIAMLANGRLTGLLLITLVPLAWTAPLAAITYFGSRSLGHDIPKLVNEVCVILGASASVATPATVPLADGDTA